MKQTQTKQLTTAKFPIEVAHLLQEAACRGSVKKEIMVPQNSDYYIVQNVQEVVDGVQKAFVKVIVQYEKGKQILNDGALAKLQEDLQARKNDVRAIDVMLNQAKGRLADCESANEQQFGLTGKRPFNEEALNGIKAIIKSYEDERAIPARKIKDIESQINKRKLVTPRVETFMIPLDALKKAVVSVEYAVI